MRRWEQATSRSPKGGSATRARSTLALPKITNCLGRLLRRNGEAPCEFSEVLQSLARGTINSEMSWSAPCSVSSLLVCSSPCRGHTRNGRRPTSDLRTHNPSRCRRRCVASGSTVFGLIVSPRPPTARRRCATARLTLASFLGRKATRDRYLADPWLTPLDRLTTGKADPTRRRSRSNPAIRVAAVPHTCLLKQRDEYSPPRTWSHASHRRPGSARSMNVQC